MHFFRVCLQKRVGYFLPFRSLCHLNHSFIHSPLLTAPSLSGNKVMIVTSGSCDFLENFQGLTLIYSPDVVLCKSFFTCACVCSLESIADPAKNFVDAFISKRGRQGFPVQRKGKDDSGNDGNTTFSLAQELLQENQTEQQTTNDVKVRLLLSPEFQEDALLRR